jgi:hypothetical protein
MNPTPQHLAAAALATLATASAIPIPLAQLDFAGAFNVFDIDNGDTPGGVVAIAAVCGVLTTFVIVLAFAGVVLTLLGASAARNTLIAAALAGLATAMPFWIPAAVILGSAALILGRRQEEQARDRPPTAGPSTDRPVTVARADPPGTPGPSHA